MLPIGLVILVIMLALRAPEWIAFVFAPAWVTLWVIWNWLKIWAVNKTGSHGDRQEEAQ